MLDFLLKKMVISDELVAVFEKAKSITIPKSREHLLEMTFAGEEDGRLDVAYDVPGKGEVIEATVVKAKNGAVVNYPEAYMRRRDPNCMLIADERPTDKERYEERYGQPFDEVRAETLGWLANQELVVMPFLAGDSQKGYPALLVCPKNAGFFVTGLADLQDFIPMNKIPPYFKPKAVLFIAPPFRHTHFEGQQVVVHNRLEEMHEVFAYNLYPGPSAKKGIYSMLLNIGEKEGWVTLHASTVQIITPYDNVVTILHEGASGGGKSEMLEEIHREEDGMIKYATNTLTGESFFLEMNDTCTLNPVTDDMALAHKNLVDDSGKLVVQDAEDGWFLRVDHIQQYGTSPSHEQLTIHPKGPLIFLNMEGQPDATCLIWEHTMDTPDKRCPNPRIVMPRQYVPRVVNQPVHVDIRSFGVRVPACTREEPTYGMLGFLQVLPPALAWLWRLVSPRGFGNPSIVDTGGMKSEGVGSYWPFATGRMVDQANLLLEQIMATPETRYVLIPNQHVGAYKVGFMTEWIGREYLARRGSAEFKNDQIEKARCPLLGYSLNRLRVNGTNIPKGLLRTHEQLEIGTAGYDAGAKILDDFFRRELSKFQSPDLHPLGKAIIDAFMEGADVEDYERLLTV